MDIVDPAYEATRAADFALLDLREYGNCLAGPGLKDSDAMSADPMRGYGSEKLFAEQLAVYYHAEHRLNVHVVRFHNIYGPLGTWRGRRAEGPPSQGVVGAPAVRRPERVLPAAFAHRPRLLDA